jgi:hypothetical protein
MKCPVMPGCARFCPLSGEGGHVSIHRIEDLKTKTRNKAKCVVWELRTRLARAGSLIPKDLWKFRIQSEAGNETAIRGAIRIGLAILDLTPTPVQVQTRAVGTSHAEARFQSAAHFGAQLFFNP